MPITLLSFMFEILSQCLVFSILLADFVSGSLLQNLKGIGETFKTLGPETVDRVAKMIFDVGEINKHLRDDVQLIVNESALWREIAQSLLIPFYLLVLSILLISIVYILRTVGVCCRPQRMKNE